LRQVRPDVTWAGVSEDAVLGDQIARDNSSMNTSTRKARLRYGRRVYLSGSSGALAIGPARGMPIADVPPSTWTICPVM
jgi:hypothetical protein